MREDELMLMNANRITRSLKRIAYQIAEANKLNKPVILLGINERGYLLAGRLGKYLTSAYQEAVDCFQLLTGEGQEGGYVKGEADLENAFLVLVDDVIFSGATMFAALRILADITNLEEVHTVALIDRGHRKLPVDAQFVGINLPTKLNEHVSLVVEEKEVQGVKLFTGRVQK